MECHSLINAKKKLMNKKEKEKEKKIILLNGITYYEMTTLLVISHVFVQCFIQYRGFQSSFT